MSATVINIDRTVQDRTIIVTFRIVQKSIHDDALIQKWGDVMVQVTGKFGDPHDPTYPPFHVSAGPDVPFFQRQQFQAHFADPTLPIEMLQKRAMLWSNAVQLQIQNRMLLMRESQDNVSTSINLPI